jgi:hypothetical protein
VPPPLPPPPRIAVEHCRRRRPRRPFPHAANTPRMARTAPTQCSGTKPAKMPPANWSGAASWTADGARNCCCCPAATASPAAAALRFGRPSMCRRKMLLLLTHAHRRRRHRRRRRRRCTPAPAMCARRPRVGDSPISTEDHGTSARVAESAATTSAAVLPPSPEPWRPSNRGIASGADAAASAATTPKPVPASAIVSAVCAGAAVASRATLATRSGTCRSTRQKLLSSIVDPQRTRIVSNCPNYPLGAAAVSSARRSTSCVYLSPPMEG